MLRGFFGPRRWFAGDVPGGGAATTGPQPKPSGQPAPEPAPKPEPKGDPAPEPDPAPKPEERTYTKAELEAALAEAKQKEERAAAAAKKKEDQETLAKNQEWEKLATTRETELAELRPKAELADELAAEANAALDTEIGTWPEELRTLDPGKDKLLERLRWAKQMRPVAAKMAAAPAQAPDTEAGKGNRKPTTKKPEGQPPATGGGAEQSYKFQTAHDVRW